MSNKLKPTIKRVTHTNRNSMDYNDIRRFYLNFVINS